MLFRVVVLCFWPDYIVKTVAPHTCKARRKTSRALTLAYESKKASENTKATVDSYNRHTWRYCCLRAMRAKLDMPVAVVLDCVGG